jgi:glucose-6-phosphate 1-dehydrogenase
MSDAQAVAVAQAQMPRARSAVAPPVSVVIFGAAGDLAHRKLLPALYNLHVDGVLPEPVAIVGVGRKDLTDDQYRAFAQDGIEHFSRRPLDPQKWDGFARSLCFANVDLDQPQGYSTLGARLDIIEHERGLPGNRLYYLAVPPSLFAKTAQELAKHRFIPPPDSGPFARLVIEKPIGHDLESAMKINDALATVFDERQIFRIDHYLGKETVQNILVMRFANSIFEPLFNHACIDHVQITVAEQEGVGTRAGYYDRAGALRDIVQNHMLQLLAVVAMEPPHALDSNVVRDEKLEVLQALRPLTETGVDSCIVRGQYGAGTINGKPVPAYRNEPGVDRASRTETYVAVQAFIDNWRWAGVPFFMRTGKRLTRRASAISIQLRGVPPILFNADRAHPLGSNVLTIRIQPDEGFALGISSKVPGPGVHISPVDMDFDYCAFFKRSSPEAYERLLLDVMIGDATLFMRRDMVETSWKWIAPIIERWDDKSAANLATYESGGWGPREADRLIEASGRSWMSV